MDDRDRYQQLQGRAQKVMRLLRDQARRAYVLEVTGTPKAGKTSAIALLESFFKASDWRVHVLRERAGLCPLPMKGHFFFNSWTTCTMLAGVLEQADQKLDLVILDRGFFDALIWLELQRARGQVTGEEADVFSKFVMLERWRKLVDLTVVMTVPPDIAMKREHFDRLVPRRGSVMNLESLEAFNDALGQAHASYGADFETEFVPSQQQDRKAVAGGLIEVLLPRIENWADAPIAVVPVNIVETIFGQKSGALRWPQGEAWAQIEAAVRMEKRSAAEADANLVQLVAGGVLTHKGGVFVFDRKRDEQRLGEYGRHSIWRGKHVDHGTGDPPLRNAARDCVIERLETDLHLNFSFEPEPLGIVWDRERERSRQHLGLMFEVSIADQTVADSLVDKEFKTSGRGHPATSCFTPLEDIEAASLEIESWSKAVLEEAWLKK